MSTEADGETTFTITGGVGSVSYTMSEIVQAGAVLAALAHRMEPLVDALTSEVVWLTNAVQGVPVPGSVFSLDGPVETVTHALWVARRAHMSANTLSQQFSAAAENYAATEARTAAAVVHAGRFAALQDGLGTWKWGSLAPLKLAADLGGWLKRAKAGGLRTATEELLNDGVAYGVGAISPGMGLAYLLAQRRPGADRATSGVRPALAARQMVDAAGLARPGHLQMRRVPVQEWGPAAQQWPPGHAVPDAPAGDTWAVEASIAGMVSGSRDAYAYPPGSLAVVRVEHPDGHPAWIVHLPGTEDWGVFDSSNPFDMEGNLEGLTAGYKDSYRQQHVLIQELIKEALHASGALPTDEVLLTGHSGGGIHAAAAAADPDFLAGVNVQMIVIAGAPAKNLEVPESISVMDLENTNDIVTALDFGAPPAGSNWVTVTSHRPPDATGGGGTAAGVGAEAAEAGAGLLNTVKEAHAVDNYVKDAQVLTASDIPAVVAQQQALAAFLGVGVGGLVYGKKFVFQGRDVDDLPRSKIPRNPNPRNTTPQSKNPRKENPRSKIPGH